MMKLIRKLFKWEPARDNNFYFGLILLKMGILSIVFYLIFDAFEPVSFLITFLLCGWGFVLLWKSDNDYRFQITQTKLQELEEELNRIQTRLARRYKIKTDKKEVEIEEKIEVAEEKIKEEASVPMEIV